MEVSHIIGARRVADFIATGSSRYLIVAAETLHLYPHQAHRAQGLGSPVETGLHVRVEAGLTVLVASAATGSVQVQSNIITPPGCDLTIYVRGGSFGHTIYRGQPLCLLTALRDAFGPDECYLEIDSRRSPPPAPPLPPERSDSRLSDISTATTEVAGGGLPDVIDLTGDNEGGEPRVVCGVTFFSSGGGGGENDKATQCGGLEVDGVTPSREEEEKPEKMEAEEQATGAAVSGDSMSTYSSDDDEDEKPRSASGSPLAEPLPSEDDEGEKKGDDADDENKENQDPEVKKEEEEAEDEADEEAEEEEEEEDEEGEDDDEEEDDAAEVDSDYMDETSDDSDGEDSKGFHDVRHRALLFAVTIVWSETSPSRGTVRAVFRHLADQLLDDSRVRNRRRRGSAGCPQDCIFFGLHLKETTQERTPNRPVTKAVLSISGHALRGLSACELRCILGGLLDHRLDRLQLPYLVTEVEIMHRWA